MSRVNAGSLHLTFFKHGCKNFIFMSVNSGFLHFTFFKHGCKNFIFMSILTVNASRKKLILKENITAS